MKALIAMAIALFMAMPAAVLAQAKPDLSGTWTFDDVGYGVAVAVRRW